MLPHNNHTPPPPEKVNDPASTAYVDWLIEVFDYWFDEARRGRVRIFNSIMKSLFGAPSDVDSFGLGPVDLIVVETNGDLEGVDTLKSTYDGAAGLGMNVFRDDFDRVARHPAIRMRQIGAASLADTCRQCQIVRTCGGGYLPPRYSKEHLFRNPSVYCPDLMKLIGHIAERICSELRTGEPAALLAGTN